MKDPAGSTARRRNSRSTLAASVVIAALLHDRFIRRRGRDAAQGIQMAVTAGIAGELRIHLGTALGVIACQAIEPGIPVFLDPRPVESAITVFRQFELLR